MRQCCKGGGRSARAEISRGQMWMARAIKLVQWVMPITGLVLVPKCPGCVAGYVLMFTGIGLSYSAASVVRWAVIVLCFAALFILLASVSARLVRPGRG